MEDDFDIDWVLTEDAMRDIARYARDLTLEIRHVLEPYSTELSTLALLGCVIEDAVITARPQTTAARMARTIQRAVARHVASESDAPSGPQRQGRTANNQRLLTWPWLPIYAASEARSETKQMINDCDGIPGMRTHGENSEPTRDPASAETGPNGGLVAYNAEGDKFEWCDDVDIDDPDKLVPLLLLRGERTIKEAYHECWWKAWYGFRRSHALREAKEGKPVYLIPERMKWIEDEYGIENLRWDDIEWGILLGRLSALSWVLGSAWEESMDT